MNTNWSKYWEETENSFLDRIWENMVLKAYATLLSGLESVKPDILEIGCGTGLNSLFLADRFDCEHLTLVDYDYNAIEYCKKQISKYNRKIKIDLIHQSAFDITRKEEFDIIHSEGLIEHFFNDDFERIIVKHADLCKKGGYIIIFAPYKSIQYSIFKTGLKIFGKWIWDEKPCNRKELIKIFNKLDLTVLNQYTSISYPQIGFLLRKKQ